MCASGSWERERLWDWELRTWASWGGGGGVVVPGHKEEDKLIVGFTVLSLG